MHLDRTPHRIDHTRELDQHPIAGGFDNPSPVLMDLRVDQLPAVSHQPGQRPFLIPAHQARVSCDISH
jgi:hypothetical protein